jgi:hypothetical protein
MEKIMNHQKLIEWIESLNPVVIDVDNDGNLSPDGIEQLKKRVIEEVKEIQTEPNIEPDI